MISPIYSLFFFSGVAALIYQVVWVRSLSLIFGGSHLAVTTVLSVFMLGLALGSFIAGRRMPQHRNLLRLYGLIEVAIGIVAIVIFLAVQVYPSVYSWLAQFSPESPAYLTVIRVLFASLLLIPATTLMGATLPILSAHTAKSINTIGKRLSILYGLNTIGAVVGVLLAGFLFLPYYTLNVTWGIAVVLNLVIGVIAIILGNNQEAIQETNHAYAPIPRTVESGSGDAKLILWGIAISGFCALAYEVLWTRVLIIGLGATDYGFTSMLASFLVGIGGGSAIYGASKHRFLPSIDQRIRFFGVVQILIGLTTFTAILFLYDLPSYYLFLQGAFEQTGVSPFTSRQLANLTLALTYLGTPALLMGFAFPLAGEIYARCKNTTGRAVGEMAAANTIGAIMGAALTGFTMISLVGIERSIHLFILVNIAYGGLLLLHGIGKPFWVWLPPSAAAVTGLVLVLSPESFKVWDKDFFAVYRSNKPEAFASRKLIDQQLKRYHVEYYGEGASSIVAASLVGKTLIFSTNGRVEATTGAQDMQNQFGLGHLPMMLHKNPKEVLVVGGGSGMTLGSTIVYPSVVQVTLVELEPKVLGVIKAFAVYNHDVLNQPKLKIVLNDGRNYLLTSKKKYDVITADPIHPWFRGAGYLYTREYFQLAASRLNEGGVVAQWLPLYQMEPEHMRSVLQTFNQAFDHAMIFIAYADAILIGSNQPLELDVDRLRAMLAIPEIHADMQQVSMGDVDALLSYFMMGDDGERRASADAVTNTDNNLYLEFFTPRAIGNQLTEWKDIEHLGKYRESCLPYLVHADAALTARLADLENSGVFRAMDHAHVLMQAGSAQSPQFQRVGGWLEQVAPRVARWEFIKNEYRPTLSR